MVLEVSSLLEHIKWREKSPPLGAAGSLTGDHKGSMKPYRRHAGSTDNRTKQIVSRVLFRPQPVDSDDHSSGTHVTVCLKRPNPEASSEQLFSHFFPPGKGAIASLFGLAPGGVYQAPGVTTGTGALLPHRFTLTEEKHAAALPFFASSWRFVFCGTFLRVTPTGRYPAPCSMEPGLSSPCYAARSDHLISFPLLSPPVRE